MRQHMKIAMTAGLGLSLVMLGGGPAGAGVPQGMSWSSGVPQVGVHIILVINKDQFEGKWKQLKGDLKKQYGKLTDDDLMQIEGNYDKFQGKIQEKYGDKKEEIERWTDEWLKKHDRKKR